MERLYSAWIDSSGLGSEDSRQLLSETSRLGQLYSDHIQVEETTVSVRSTHVLDSNSMAAIGTEFRFRRKQPGGPFCLGEFGWEGLADLGNATCCRPINTIRSVIEQFARVHRTLGRGMEWRGTYHETWGLAG